MIYLFHGPDEFGRAEAVADLRQRLFTADALAELNYTELDGRHLTVAELQTRADTLPFMGERRLVVVHGLVGRCNPQGGEGPGRAALADALTTWLPRMVPTTRLVLADEAVHANNPVLKWAETYRAAQATGDDAVVVRHFPAPDATALPRWLAVRAQAAGGAIEPAAANALTEALDREGRVDLRLAAGELTKLLTFAGPRAVTADDVALLVTPVTLDKVFAFTDALAERNGPAAATLLHTFLDHGEAPLRLLALVTRQIRQLVLARAVLDAGGGPTDVQQRLGVPPFVAKKLGHQARQFPTPVLSSALRQLLELETRIKTGQIDGALALDLFVAEMAGVGMAADRRVRR
jgi:DNA polymerase III subunit delta